MTSINVDLDDDGLNINRKLSLLKHIKKKAANDAQLLMNRIALIQKEEERARKKIDQTKQRAEEILSLRNETEKRVEAFTQATGQEKQIQQILQLKNREQDIEGKKARAYKIESLRNKKKEEVNEMLKLKETDAKRMIQEQEREIRIKQAKKDEIKRMEEEAKRKKEEERREKERKVKEIYEQKLKEEAAEAKRAEKLVKALEKREREWIERLKQAQTVQESAFEQLEYAILKEPPHNNNNNNNYNNKSSYNNSSPSSRDKEMDFSSLQIDESRKSLPSIHRKRVLSGKK